MKASTENEYQRKVNKVIDYISTHLHHPINLTSLAREVCISPYHFHRIMGAYLNEPLGTYITRQRVERAATYLQQRPVSLQELAEKVGYETPQSFSKAFKKHFGISPIAFRKICRSEFTIKRKENSFVKLELQPEIEEVPGLNLVYIRIFGAYGDKDLYTKAWKKLGRHLKVNNLLTKETRWIGLSFDDPNITLHANCRFYACATVSEEISSQGEFGYINIPSGRFAVYKYKSGKDSLQNLYNNIYYNLTFELRDSMSFEEYIYESGNINEEDMITKVYLPVK